MAIKSIKVQLSIFLILFALYVSFTGKDALFLLSLGISLIAAIAADSIIVYLKTKKIIITESSVVSGLIIGYVLSSNQAWWMIAFASILAISSKHLIRFKARHIFNPAGFGILTAVFLFSSSTCSLHPGNSTINLFSKIRNKFNYIFKKTNLIF